MSLFEELKRRNVFRVGAAYTVATWVLAQVVDLFLGYADAPDWIMHVFLLFAGIGFVAAIIVAWAYELTPEGIKREKDVDRSNSVVADTGRKLDRIIIIFLAFAVVLLLADRFLRPPGKMGSEPFSASNGTVPEQGDPQKRALTPAKSIAVLPFVNMSNDSENEFFSDGIAEEILNVLSSIPELKVAARTSAFAYKGTNTNIANIADELGVNHVLEGSVRKVGNQVRVTAQLIQASDGFHLWSDNYDRELTNIFAIQDEIAGSIADALKVTLKLEAGESGNLTGTTSIEAYEHYLRGMQHWHLRTVADLEQAIKEFDAAIALDPDFAKAHAGLALAWGVISGYTDKYAGVENKNALAAARRALELDPDNVEAKATIGVIYRYDNQQAESRKFFEEAIATNPSFATAHQWYGGLLGEMGDPEAGLEEYRKAWSLDPRSRIIGYNLAYRLWGLGRVDEAWQVIGEVIEFAPDFPDALGLALTMGVFAGQCDRVAHYASRLIAVLKKPASSKQLYLDMCQSEDSGRRRAAEETILSWDRYAFADAEHPTLSYTADLQAIFVERGNFDAFWNIADKEGNRTWTMTWIRIFETDNAIHLQCSDRYQQALKQYGISPAIKPVSCP